MCFTAGCGHQHPYCKRTLQHYKQSNACTFAARPGSFQLYFRSPRLDAAAALEMGLVNEVLDDDDFGQAAVHWCMDVASKAPIALSRMKENINLAAAVDLATALDNEAVNMAFTMSTEDHKEAAAAFVEKRAPRFRGK